jgi:ElaB/YqjD/DUF883 family membrane-anchored ribosome-binding protein
MANPTNTKDFDKTREAAGQAAEKTKEAAHTIGDKTKEAASAVGDLVSSAASTAAGAVGRTADRLTSSAGSGVKHLGETIKEKGPQSGMFGSASRAVGDTLEQGGRYVEQEGLSGMMNDLSDVIRHHPMPAVLIGIGIGFLIGRTLGS